MRYAWLVLLPLLACAKTAIWEDPGWQQPVEVILETSSDSQSWAVVGCQPDGQSLSVTAPDANYYRARAIERGPAATGDCDIANAAAISEYSNVYSELAGLLPYSSVDIAPVLPWAIPDEPELPMALSTTPDFWWKLDETSGTAVSNAGSYGTPSDYDGVLTLAGASGSYTWLTGSRSWGAGGITGGLNLSPPDSDPPAQTGYFVEINTPLPIEGLTKLTIAFWYKMDGTPADSRVFFQGDTFNESGHQFMAGEASEGRARVRVRTDTNGGSTSIDGATSYATHTDVHTAWVLDLTKSGNELELYLDGVLDQSFNISGSTIAADSVFTATGGLRALIGASTNDGTSATAIHNIVDGELADIRIWRGEAATSGEVEDIYDNALSGGSTETVGTSLDAIVQKQQAITASLDSYLQKPDSESTSIDALLQKTQSVQASLDAAIQKSLTRTTNLDGLLQSAETLATSLDALLAQQRAASVSVDAYLSQRQTAGVSLDAAVQAARTLAASLDAAIQQQKTGVVSLDGVLSAAQALTASLDAVLQKRGNISTSIDAILASIAAQTISTNLDANLQKSQTASTSLDGYIQQPGTISTVLDALLRQAQSGTVSLDANLQKQQAIATALDAVLQASGEATVILALDAVIQATQTESVSLDVLLSKTGTTTASLDVNLQQNKMVSTALDAAVRALQTESISLDALLRQAKTAAASLDGIVGLRGTLALALDALVRKTFARTASLDANLQKRASAGTSLNAVLAAEGDAEWDNENLTQLNLTTIELLSDLGFIALSGD